MNIELLLYVEKIFISRGFTEKCFCKLTVFYISHPLIFSKCFRCVMSSDSGWNDNVYWGTLVSHALGQFIYWHVFEGGRKTRKPAGDTSQALCWLEYVGHHRPSPEPRMKLNLRGGGTTCCSTVPSVFCLRNKSNHSDILITTVTPPVQCCCGSKYVALLFKRVLLYKIDLL